MPCGSVFACSSLSLLLESTPLTDYAAKIVPLESALFHPQESIFHGSPRTRHPGSFTVQTAWSGFFEEPSVCVCLFLTVCPPSDLLSVTLLTPAPLSLPSVNACPRNCSGRGECRLSNTSRVVECDCLERWKGAACDVPYCQDECGFPERGQCSAYGTPGCLCHSGWQGG